MAELDELIKLNANIKKLLTINQLEYNFDQARYLAQKVRAGEAVSSKGSLYIPIAPGATSTLVMPTPAGFVWIPHFISYRSSQDGVIEWTIMVDDQLDPWIYFPRSVDVDFDIKEIVPYDLVVKERAILTYTNHDALLQWVVIGWFTTFVRKDVWEKDIAVINQMAQQFQITPGAGPPPLPPGGG